MNVLAMGARRAALASWQAVIQFWAREAEYAQRARYPFETVRVAADACNAAARQATELQQSFLGETPEAEGASFLGETRETGPRAAASGGES